MRRDIQMLRGIAVLAVVFYHAGFSAFTGGYLGVDLFFVISGFVITSRLMSATGGVKEELLYFYRRRVKRILPSSLAVLLLTTVASAFFLAKISFARFAQDAVATAFMGGNILFAHQKNDYLSQSLDPSPFLHYWSLGVEEQFYILWPIIFLLVIRKRKDFVIPLFLGTAAFAIWYTTIAPINAFYLPWSRAFEFLGGAAVALYPKKKTVSGGRGILAFFLPLYLMLNLFMSIDSSFATPGPTTLILVILSALAIRNGATINERSKIGGALIWFGDLSFTLYLVHWPVTVFFLARTDALTVYDKWEIVLISTALAILVTRFIETPMRFNKKLVLSIPRWALAITASAALSFTGFHAFASGGTPLQIDTSKPSIYTNGCHLSFSQSWPTKPCEFGDKNSSTTIMLVGDSHAAQWFPAVEKIALDKGWKFISITKSSCPATLLDIKQGTGATCKKFQRELSTKINQIKPAHLLISNFTEWQYGLTKPTTNYPKTWASGQEAFVKTLAIPHSAITILGDTPYPMKDSTTCLSLHSSKPSTCNFAYLRSDATQAIKDYAKSASLQYINTAEWLCSDATCSALYGKANNYRDNTHISVKTALRLAPQLEAAIASAK